MNQDIDTWINHMSRNNKRKRDANSEEMMNELICMSVENFIDMINENNITKYNGKKFILSLEKTLIKTRNLLNNVDNDNINNDVHLLLCASVAATLDIIKLMKEKYKKISNFDIINFLNNYKKDFNIPKKNRKLNIKTIKFEGTQLVETSDENYTDETYDSDEMYENISPRNITVKKFNDRLKKISDENNSTKNEVIQFFNNMSNTMKQSTITTLDKLAEDNSIPSLFRIISAPLNDSTKKTLISKILNLSNGMVENNKLKKWLDDVMKLPFGVMKGMDISNIQPNKIKTFLNKMKTKMDEAVWGHDDAKKDIIKIMAQQIRNPNCKGNVIGIYGCAGSGKTSLIKHGIAEAMDKPFIFISLGGATDSSYLDGHSFTYEGSIYGRIAQALIESKCMNPIIYFDELDKVSTTEKGDEIINLLIHLIDPVQNQQFRDKYFYDVDIDLSKVTFIFSFNDPSLVNYILLDRITLIETKHLTLTQKLHIGANYLMKDILKDVGMKENSITIPGNLIEHIILTYTHEGGVRTLKKHLYSIVRELNVANLTNTKIGKYDITFPLVYTKELLDIFYYGKMQQNMLTVHKNDGVGMVNGLWANSMGVGGILPIETVLIPTNEVMSVKATGSLGNVIKESIEVAMSVAWNHLSDDYKNKWMKKWKTKPERFHVHCPDGSTEKEGPSAGTAMSLAFYSLLTERKIRCNVAMTGEINLNEEVSCIGGLEEKLCAAKIGGATHVLVPKENEIDMIEIKKRYPNLLDGNFKVTCIKNLDDVIKIALL